MNDKARREKTKEILSEPRTYTDNDIQGFLLEFGYETGVVMLPQAMVDLFEGSTKGKIFYFSSMILFVNTELHNITLDQKENYIKHLAYIVCELSKDL
ncbi:hypothetical protein ACRS9I_05840 [Pseudomonas aeruginosa]